MASMVRWTMATMFTRLWRHLPEPLQDMWDVRDGLLHGYEGHDVQVRVEMIACWASAEMEAR
jgi:hypothetical protein